MFNEHQFFTKVVLTIEPAVLELLGFCHDAYDLSSPNLNNIYSRNQFLSKFLNFQLHNSNLGRYGSFTLDFEYYYQNNCNSFNTFKLC